MFLRNTLHTSDWKHYLKSHKGFNPLTPVWEDLNPTVRYRFNYYCSVIKIAINQSPVLIES